MWDIVLIKDAFLISLKGSLCPCLSQLINYIPRNWTVLGRGDSNAFSSVAERAKDMWVWSLPSESPTKPVVWNSSQLRMKFVLLRKLCLWDSTSGVGWSSSQSTAGAETITVVWEGNMLRAGSCGCEVQAFGFASQAQFPGAWPKQCSSGAGHFLHLFPWKLPGGKPVL